MSTAYTFFFSDIFPTYEKWQEFTRYYDIFPNGEVNNPTIIAFDKYCYKLLSRYFWNSNIRYSDPNAFCRALANVYEDRFAQFKYQTNLVKTAHNLNGDDLLTVQEALNNIADNPNTIPSNPRAPLKYISSQTYSYVNNNKLRAYLEALNNIPNLRINEFIRGRAGYRNEISFLDLFMNVQPNIDYIYNNKE